MIPNQDLSPSFPRGAAALALSLTLVCGLAAPALAHDMMFVGRDSSGKLAIFIEEGIMPSMMEPSIFPEFPGWVQAELGLETIDQDTPELDLFTISSQADVTLLLVATDPGVVLQKDGFEGPLQVGEQYTLGNPYFHLHPIWNITEPEIDRIYHLTFVLHDRAGVYPDSEPFTLTFGCIPCPSDFDRSAFVDVDDFVSFVHAFEAGDDTADFDASGFVDTDDFDGFVHAFELGC